MFKSTKYTEITQSTLVRYVWLKIKSNVRKCLDEMANFRIAFDLKT